MVHVAICVWGICRSTDHTIASVQKHIFQPLQDAGIETSIFLHTYTLYRPYENPRAGESKQQLKNTLWKLFKPTKSIVEDQDSVDRTLQLDTYRTHGNPWSNEDGKGFQTLDNHIRALWSLYQVTKLWMNDEQNYDAIMYIRPDVEFLTSLRPSWFQQIPLQTLFVPNFHLIDGVNDRFAFGRPEVMKHYGTRFLQAKQYSYQNQLHSESFLAWVCGSKNIQIHTVSIKFRRIRADGTIFEGDKTVGL